MLVFSTIDTSPVVFPPNVNVWLFVVPKTPVPVRKVLLFPLFAEIDAVGVPMFKLITANFAPIVEKPPTRKSTELFLA
jgi:hypothetical protein